MDAAKEITVILVTGATGTVGRQVVTQLSERGLPVRSVTRDPASAGQPAGVEVVRGDLADPASLEPHLAGADAVFLVWPFTSPELAAGPGARVVELLARHVARVVYLSAQAAAGRPDSFWAVMERLIEDSGVAWTFLRPTGFAANTLMWADQIRSQGVVRWPYGAATRSLVHESDLAAVAVRALTEDRHAGCRYLLTGPEAITQADQARIIGEATGRAVRWEELSPEEARRQLLTAWGDPGFVDSALATWARLVTRPEPVTRTVEEITGTPARTFRQWAADHASDFRLPSTVEVADRYVSAFRAGDLDAALQLLAADVLRVAPLETGDGPGELRGVQQIMDNSGRLNADYQIHAVEIDDPFVRGDQFAVRFAFDRTHLPTGKRETAVKISLYTVAGAAIVREEVYYHTPQHTPGH
jgi:uncharacterized protein YbjT (DUF2867 family)/ketosteroid isomerase-like protein